MNLYSHPEFQNDIFTSLYILEINNPKLQIAADTLIQHIHKQERQSSRKPTTKSDTDELQVY
jgi:hypothetical protein